ncbi:response regulator transcription factor [Pseudomonas simiae]|uniref:response regulator transcription factor n=1 Tax=Pseudomonas simiae TaxID=321846 RepID=UPI002159A15D|nr:LuxR C-terminal-related transcriptional regulator [Pseudomonas simiae]
MLNITNRESAVLSFLVLGLTNKEIGRELGISDHTVRDHISSMLKKTNTTNRVELAVKISTMKRPR